MDLIAEVLSQLQPDSNFERIFEVLSSENPTAGLQELSDLLLYSDNSLFIRMPVSKYATILTKIFNSSKSIPDLILVSSCIHNLIDAHQNAAAAFEQAHVLSTAGSYLTKIVSMPLAENCLRIFDSISIQKPASIGEQCGLNPLIQNISQFTLIDQRHAISTLNRVTKFFVSEGCCSILDPLAQLFTNADETVSTQAIQAFCNIAKNMDIDNIPTSIIEKIAVSLLVLTDPSSVSHLLKVLRRLLTKPKNALNFLKLEPDFYIIFENTKSNIVFNEILKSAVIIILELLPPPISPIPNPDYQIPEISYSFAAYIQPLIEEFLINRVGCELLLLQALAPTVRVKIPERLPELLPVLAGYAMVEGLAPYVLQVCYNFYDKSVLKNSEVTQSLKYIRTKYAADFFNEIGEEYIGSINELWNIETIDDLISATALPTYQLVAMNAFPHIIAYLQKFKGKVTPQIHEILIKIFNLARDVLDVVPLEEEDDPLKSGNAKQFMAKSLKFTLKSGEKEIPDISAEITLDFAAVEGWYNEKNKGDATNAITNDVLRNTMESDKELSRIINKSEANKSESSTRLAMLHRAFKTPGYVHYHFVMGGKLFSIYDSLFQAFCSIVPSISSIVDTIPIITMEEGDIDRAEFSVPKKEVPNISQPLELISLIHKIDPTIPVECEKFSAHVLPHLSSPALTIGRFSNATSLIYNYPFVFTLKVRILFCQLAAFDVPFALQTTHQRFVETSDKTRFNQIHLQVKIDRDNIFNDGMLLLERIGPGRCYLDVNFIGEDGIGNGPAQEFFTLFSHECCKNSHRFWRTDDWNSEYAINSNGLFPLPTNNYHFMYIIGLLCSKAMSMECLSSIPFNPAIFSYIRGETIKIEDVDPVLANSLLVKEGLYDLAFVYPGLNDVELKPNGKKIYVNEKNVDEYIELVTDFTIGSKLRELADSFIRGFSSVISWTSMNIFSIEELIPLLSGQKCNITFEDLERNVEVSHGYEPGSPQIRMLFETIAEMDDDHQKLFIKFVTGNQMLPIGGLTAMRPKLTVALRTPLAPKQSPDVTLPSVMTCVNYLKLPAYSSKSIMKKQIYTAIENCQNSFNLS